MPVVDTFEQCGELVTAESRRGVARTQARLKSGGHDDEQVGSDSVAEGVVDALGTRLSR